MGISDVGPDFRSQAEARYINWGVVLYKVIFKAKILCGI